MCDVAGPQLTRWQTLGWTSSVLSLLCLEDGADPASIEKVAQQVLSIKFPVPRTTLEKMILQIKDSLSNITNVEGIVNHSSKYITKAKELLGQAKDAKYVTQQTLQAFKSSKPSLHHAAFD